MEGYSTFPRAQHHWNLTIRLFSVILGHSLERCCQFILQPQPTRQIQEHRYYLSEQEIKYHDAGKGWTIISESAWKHTVNAVIGVVGMNLISHALKL